MDLTLRTAESMLVVMMLFGAALVLRGTKVLTEQHAGVLAKAIT